MPRPFASAASRSGPSSFSRSTRLYQVCSAHGAVSPFVGSDLHRFVEPVGSEIATGRWPGSCPPSPAHRTRRGCRRADLWIVLVLVIEIDALDPEPAQRRFAGARDHVGLSVGDIFAVNDWPQEADLGRDHDLVALGRIALQPAADNASRFRRLDDPAPRRNRRRRCRSSSPPASTKASRMREAGALVGGPAEDIAAERERRDLDIARSRAAHFD